MPRHVRRAMIMANETDKNSCVLSISKMSFIIGLLASGPSKVYMLHSVMSLGYSVTAPQAPLFISHGFVGETRSFVL